MMAAAMERYTTPTGVHGVPLVDFLPVLQRESRRRLPPGRETEKPNLTWFSLSVSPAHAGAGFCRSPASKGIRA